MRSLPLSVRVAAGLAATAIESVRKVPGQLAELPVTAASHVVQAGMRLQQRVTELAIKGDDVLSLFRPVQDTPPWARFDEDDDPQSPPPTGSEPAGNGSARVSGGNSPTALPGYDEMSLAQLRGKLRALSLAELEELLEHEHTHQDRAPFVTMLANRISTVRTR